jgi:glutaminyl-peptide cyclotransferase
MTGRAASFLSTGLLLALLLAACRAGPGATETAALATNEPAVTPATATEPAPVPSPTRTPAVDTTTGPPSPSAEGQPEPPGLVTPVLPCTPPACTAAEVLTCPSGDCPGGCGAVCSPATQARTLEFDGERAYEDLLAQMELGPRYPGSPGHRAVGDLIIAVLDEVGWAVEEQPLTYQGVEGRNLIARANEGAGPIIILGAHYDSRAIADQSPGELAQEPVPGAVDGASGVAVLLELARVLDLDLIPHELWLAFFDFEDQGGGGMPDWDWIVGSTYMAQNLEVEPQAMILVDMIGDADQQLYYEGYSDPELRAEIWELAASLGYGDVFIPEVRHYMLDDHRPFLDRGIPAVDIIDFDYAYWHTVEDTADKAAPESLERVGRTLEAWLEDGR